MSEPKFTKEPWEVSKNQPTVVGTREKSVCKCELDWNLGAGERKTNAALIAAAPDMYAMLEELATCGAIANGLYVAKIKKLLAKARGEG